MKNEFEIRKEKILEYINSSDYTKMTAKQLAVIFVVPKEEFVDFEKILFKLEREGYIYFDDSKRICKADFTKIFTCKFEAKSRGFGFGRVITPEENINITEIKDIYISRENSAYAFDGDTILVELLPKSDGKNKEGKVIRIIKRTEENVVGVFEEGNGFGFVVPINTAIEDIYIPGKKTIGLKDRDAVEVRIVKFPTLSKKAEGKIINVIGNMSERDTETDAILANFNIKDSFRTEVINEAKFVSSQDISKEFIGRVDYRKNHIYTIDGDDAKDLDDAVVVIRNKEEDTFTLSVHIADVSHYVRKKSELDKEAIIRGTSVYTPALVVPMLPKELSNGICSLNQGEDRLALAVDAKIDKKGKILDSNIYKSIIKVTKRMSYTKVQEVLDRSNRETLYEYMDYIEDVELMAELAKILKAKREREGSINFDIPETKVILDEKGEVEDIKPYEITFANSIIEEFMLVANKIVAETFCNLDAPFIYRIHETPDVEKLRELNEVIGYMGISIKGINNIHPRALADAMKAVNECNDKQKSMVVSALMLRSLKLAKYSEKCLGHFGLGFKYYCHFTSPIRRYPDLFIHRVIKTYIDNNYSVDEDMLRSLYKEAIEYSFTSSDREKNATEVEREFDNMYKARYMKKHIGDVFEGYISGVTKFGLYVKLPNTVEGMITMNNLLDDYYIYEEGSMKLVGQRTGKIYEIGQALQVQVIRADDRLKQIDFQIVGDKVEK